jgi:hypothetical protein
MHLDALVAQLTARQRVQCEEEQRKVRIYQSCVIFLFVYISLLFFRSRILFYWK